MLTVLRSSGTHLIVAYTLLSIGAAVSNGIYSSLALLFVCAAFLFLCLSLARDRRNEPFIFSTTVLTLCLASLLFTSLHHAPLLYAKHLWFIALYRLIATLLLILLPFAHLLPFHCMRALQLPLTIAGITVALFLRFAVPIASPSPIIDVFAMSQESSQHFLEGRNPYRTPITDVYQGGENFGYDSQAYIYPPASLFLRALGVLLTGDARYVSALAETIFCVVLWYLLRRESSQKRELLLLMFVWHPASLFVIEQAWMEPLLLMLLAAAIVAYIKHRSYISSALLGYMISAKQSLVFFLVHWLLLERRVSRLLLGVCVGFFTILPFVVWDTQSLIERGFLFTLLTPFRTDALTLSSFVFRQFAIKTSVLWTLGIGVGMTVFTSWYFWKRQGTVSYLSAGALTTFALFLFGSQAFCNYYYFVGGMLLLLIALRAGKSEEMAVSVMERS